ncbi:hypothetical protein [Micromonospora musae]|uniref:Uncharacterized protein n=1 Tax=Micromonospora musae TaxID=1894970 RepID=A0A3A9Y9B2_9ACTN|nr:hypothetical protein [Micromonospora musae]RKN33878.1 hypothetical protein D7044_09040 [Micromonospora musae]
MGYTLEAVIASSSLLRVAVQAQPTAVVVGLPQPLAIVPITDGLFDAVTTTTSDRSLGFWKLPGGFDRVLADWSSTGPVSYVEAEFFGGVGRQRAALWVNGELTVGPLSVEEGQPFAEAGSPISQVLRELGVDRAGYRDEFEAVGLTRRRDKADWLP